MDEELDISGNIVQTRGAVRAKRLREEADEYMQEIERRNPPPVVPVETNTPTLGDAISPVIPVGNITKDVLKGIMETPRAILGGARDAVQETLESMDSLTMWINENAPVLQSLDEATGLEGPIGELPDVSDPESTTGNMIKSASQFITGFVPALKVMRGISGGKAASRLGQFTQAEAAAAVSSALVFDPHEARLSNLIQSAPALENPVTEYLAASPDDNEAEGRLKSALEGLALAPVAEGMAIGLRAIRANRIEKGVDPSRPLGEPDASIIDDLGDVDLDFLTREAEASAPTGALDERLATARGSLKERETKAKELASTGTSVRFEHPDGRKALASPDTTEPGKWRLTVFKDGEPFGHLTYNKPQEAIEEGLRQGFDLPGAKKSTPKLATEEVADAFLNSGQLPFDLKFKMNWAKFSSSEQATEVLNDVARLFEGKIDDARRGVIQDTELRKLAVSIGMQPEQLLARRAGGVMTAEQIMASKMILDSASQQLLNLARKARDSTDSKDQFAFRRMLDIHAGLQKQMQGAASEAGRAFRALRVPTGSTESQIEQITEALMKDGGPDKLRQLATKLSEINDPDLINEAVRKGFGRRVSDALVEIWYMDLLSGPQTHAVNMASNSLNVLWQIPERFLAEQAGRTLGNPGVVEGEARELLYGLVTSLPDAIRLAGRAFVSGEATDIFNKVEARTQEAITAENFPIGKQFGRIFGDGVGRTIDMAVDGFGTFIRLPTRALMGEDEFFRTVGKSMAARSLALRQATKEGLEGKDAARRIQELIRNPDNSMLEAQQAFARELTFTTPLGTGGRAIQMAVNRHPWAKAALPFIRTPANLFKWAGRRTPLALLSGNIRRDIARGGPEGDLALARIGMGSMVAMAFADLAFNGYVTGYGPTDKDQRRVWMETHQPWSIKVGNTWYSYNRGDPFGMLIGSAASYAEIAAGADYADAEELATAIAVATAQSVTNKTWLRGVSQTLDAATQPDRHAAKWAREQIGTLLVPTGAAQIARLVDPVWRDVQSINDAIKSRIPGYSDEVPPMRNLFGHPVPLEGGLGPDIISPVYTKSVKQSPIASWMEKNRVLPDRPGRTRAGVEMTPKQYDRFQELAGHAFKDPLTGLGLEETLNAIVEGTHPQSYLWEQHTDGPKGGRSVIVKSMIQNFRDLAWAQLLSEDRELAQRHEAVRHEDVEAMRSPVMRPTAGRAP